MKAQPKMIAWEESRRWKSALPLLLFFLIIVSLESWSAAAGLMWAPAAIALGVPLA